MICACRRWDYLEEDNIEIREGKILFTREPDSFVNFHDMPKMGW